MTIAIPANITPSAKKYLGSMEKSAVFGVESLVWEVPVPVDVLVVVVVVVLEVVPVESLPVVPAAATVKFAVAVPPVHTTVTLWVPTLKLSKYALLKVMMVGDVVAE